MNITIEKASAKDAEALLELLKAIGSETENLSFGSEGLPFSITDEEQYLDALYNSSDGIMLLAKENEKIIASASLNRLPRRMSHRGELSISVLKDYWNQGIGKRLMSAIIEFAKENYFSIIELQVRSDNTAAIHLYEKFGFIKTGTHPYFFAIDGKAIPFDYMCLQI